MRKNGDSPDVGDSTIPTTDKTHPGTQSKVGLSRTDTPFKLLPLPSPNGEAFAAPPRIA